MFASEAKAWQQNVSKLVSALSPVNHKGLYVGAEGDFPKEIYIVQWTCKAEIRPEEQSEKAESYRENSWSEIRSKGPQRQK